MKISTLSVQRGCMSANGQRLCFEEEGETKWLSSLGAMDEQDWRSHVLAKCDGREVYLSAFLAVMDTMSFGGLTDSAGSSILDGIGARGVWRTC